MTSALAAAHLVLSTSSAERDREAREQAVVMIANARVVLEEAGDILEQAESFTTVTTWIHDLSRVEHQIAQVVRAMAASAGLVTADR